MPIWPGPGRACCSQRARAGHDAIKCGNHGAARMSQSARFELPCFACSSWPWVPYPGMHPLQFRKRKQYPPWLNFRERFPGTPVHTCAETCTRHSGDFLGPRSLEKEGILSEVRSSRIKPAGILQLSGCTGVGVLCCYEFPFLTCQCLLTLTGIPLHTLTQLELYIFSGYLSIFYIESLMQLQFLGSPRTLNRAG